ncbi:integral membrane protein DUF106-domain-containing protein [Limtongia smithiae]|uniref:integral membrane protein DUF106-domain-containing protein n=1 Tax=Limtongia smithiae TaxID=1125753 RepID=UPI0034CDCDD1
MAAAPELVLDPSLRDWVLFPILLVMILVGILRHYITQLLQAPPKQLELSAIREQQSLARGPTLRSNGQFIPPASFLSRKTYLIKSFREGIFLKDQEAFQKRDEPKPPANPLTEPGGMDQMMDMVKGQMVMIIPQTVLMSWVNFFFSGFILMKLPFPLTIRFKSILQSGVATKDLDVRWVSSISWYFLNLFGLRSVYDILLGSNNSAGGGMADAMNSGGMGMGGMGGMGIPGMGQSGPDIIKTYFSEAENLELSTHIYILDDIEDRIFLKYDTETF